MKRFLPPIFLSLAILVIAPVMQEARVFLFDLFPGSALRLLSIFFAGVLVLSMVVAIARIRSHHRLRYGGLVLVLAMLWLQAVGFRQDDLAVNLVERFHVVEYGILAILFYRAFRSRGGADAVLSTLAWTIIVGILDEGVQWIAPQRTAELRDVAMNAAAALTGVLLALCIWPPGNARIDDGRRLVRLGAGVVALLGLFVYNVHLGYEIDDPEVGRFRSWHTAEELLRLSAARAVEWDVPDPPSGLELCCVQDYYLTEAARHLQHRNKSFQDGLYRHAWHANRVLEKYFAPYLDKPLPKGHKPRAGKHMTRQLERFGKPDAPAGYSSPVLRDRIFVRPSKPVFLALLVLLVAALWLATLLPRPRR